MVVLMVTYWINGNLEFLNKSNKGFMTLIQKSREISFSLLEGDGHDHSTKISKGMEETQTTQVVMDSLGETEIQLLKWEVDTVINRLVTNGNTAILTVFIYKDFFIKIQLMHSL